MTTEQELIDAINSLWVKKHSIEQELNLCVRECEAIVKELEALGIVVREGVFGPSEPPRISRTLYFRDGEWSPPKVIGERDG